MNTLHQEVIRQPQVIRSAIKDEYEVKVHKLAMEIFNWTNKLEENQINMREQV